MSETPASLRGSVKAMELSSCRQDIERAAATKVQKGAAISIRQCLLEVGFDAAQANNRTMQARVRREVQRLSIGKRDVQSKLKKRAAAASMPPMEIFAKPHKDNQDDDDDDGISVLTDASSLRLPNIAQNHFPLLRSASNALASASDGALTSSMVPPSIVTDSNSLHAMIHATRTFSPDIVTAAPSDLQSGSRSRPFLMSLENPVTSAAHQTLLNAQVSRCLLAPPAATTTATVTAATTPLSCFTIGDMLPAPQQPQQSNLLTALSQAAPAISKEAYHDIQPCPLLLYPFATACP